MAHATVVQCAWLRLVSHMVDGMTSKLAHSTWSFWGSRAEKKCSLRSCKWKEVRGNTILEGLFGNVLPKNLTSLIRLSKGVSNPRTRRGPCLLSAEKGRCRSCGLSWAIWAVLSDLHDISLVKEQRVKDLKRIFPGKKASGAHQTLSLAPMWSNMLLSRSSGGREIWLATLYTRPKICPITFHILCGNVSQTTSSPSLLDCITSSCGVFFPQVLVDWFHSVKSYRRVENGPFNKKKWAATLEK